jgi:hypothetical protein
VQGSTWARYPGALVVVLAGTVPAGDNTEHLPVDLDAPADRPTIMGYETVQAVPLSVNELGLPVSPVWVAWKPMPTDPFAGMLAL